MTTFYLLPPRAVLGHRVFAALGIPLAQSPVCAELADAISKTIETMGALVVYRDDLPLDEEPARALVDGFGAEAGDEIIEIGSDHAPRHWQLPPRAA